MHLLQMMAVKLTRMMTMLIVDNVAMFVLKESHVTQVFVKENLQENLVALVRKGMNVIVDSVLMVSAVVIHVQERVVLVIWQALKDHVFLYL